MESSLGCINDSKRLEATLPVVVCKMLAHTSVIRETRWGAKWGARVHGGGGAPLATRSTMVLEMFTQVKPKPFKKKVALTKPRRGTRQGS